MNGRTALEGGADARLFTPVAHFWLPHGHLPTLAVLLGLFVAIAVPKIDEVYR